MTFVAFLGRYKLKKNIYKACRPFALSTILRNIKQILFQQKNNDFLSYNI